MTETIRFHNACCHLGQGCTLAGYSLTIFAGEIVCLAGISGNGKTAIEKVLTGQAVLSEGTLFVHGQKQPHQAPLDAVEKGIYSIGISNPMASNMSIMDNLEAIKPVRNPFCLYRPKREYQKVSSMLRTYGIGKAPSIPVNELSFLEEQVLSVIKVVRNGAKLVLINCVQNSFSDQDAVALGKVMKTLTAEGVSFLIISERPSPFFDIADKVQLIHKGMDMYQWENSGLAKADFAKIPGQVARPQERKGQSDKMEAIIVLDMNWSAKEPVATFLKTLQKRNKDIWNQYIDITIPPIGDYYDGKTAVIPFDSGDKLLSNLSIADNVVICIADRIGMGCLRVVHKGMKKVAVHDFYQMLGIPSHITQIHGLTELQRKILSIHRWVLTQPHAIVLENPFSGMGFEQIRQLNAYLASLAQRHIRLVVCSRQLWDFENDNVQIILSDAGKNAVLT